MIKKAKLLFKEKKKDRLTINILPGKNCNYKCKMCHMWKNEREKGLSGKEWIETIVKTNTSNYNEVQVSIGGGEPYLHNCTFDIMRACKNLGYKCYVSTNGSLLTPSIIRRSITEGANVINISLDSMNEKKHDSIRGIPGSYDKVMKAISYLENNNLVGYMEEKKIGLSINTVIMKPNLRDVIDVAHWILQKGFMSFNVQAVVQPFETPLDKNWYKQIKYRELWPNKQDIVNEVIDSLIQLKKDKFTNKMNNTVTQLGLFKKYFANPNDFIKHRGCSLVDKNAITVNSDGSVQLCPYMNSIGNVKNTHLNRITNSKKAKKNY